MFLQFENVHAQVLHGFLHNLTILKCQIMLCSEKTSINFCNCPTHYRVAVLLRNGAEGLISAK